MGLELRPPNAGQESGSLLASGRVAGAAWCLLLSLSETPPGRGGREGAGWGRGGGGGAGWGRGGRRLQGRRGACLDQAPDEEARTLGS